MQTQKATTGKANPLPVVLSLTVSARMVRFSSEEGRETSSDTTPLASVAGSVRMRSTDSDRSVRATPKKARDASPPPHDLWVVVKNLSQQVAAQQAEMDALRNTIALQQKATANLEKILSNMASQAASTNCGYQAKHHYSTATTTATIATTTDQPSKDTRFADAVKRRPTHQQLVERQPEFRKAGAAAWLALKRETSVPAHSAPKWSSPRVFDSFMQAVFPTQSLATFERQCRARIRTSAVRDIRWISLWTRLSSSPSKPGFLVRAADKDKLAAILSFAAKTVTTIQRSPDVKARNFFRSLLASIGGKPSRQPLPRRPRFGFKPLTLAYHTGDSPKESLPVKTATEKEPAAPAVDPPSDMAAEVTPAIQDDGVTPTVTPIADVEMCL
ncbi:hypothetical protein BASA83_006725 [Batrachochytrium salamandrivorans]|nr:hypothetical protein BASA83_006725 [Batrachochytrium salamandrivorans]